MADSSVQDNISKMKVADLKKELKARGLSCIGNKTELMLRLQTALEESETGKLDTLSSEELMDDVLNDEDLDDDIDDDVVDAEKTLDLESAIIIREDEPLSPALHVSKPTLKRKSSNVSTDENSFIKAPPKKIVLNRALSVSAVTTPTDAEKPIIVAVKKPVPITDVDTNQSEEKKVIKLSNLTAKERLEMRAKKFGTPLTADQKKEARMERFGSTGSTNSKIGTVSTKLDVLKKRAERFGGSVSTVMSKIDLQERLEKRKARFGATTTATKKETPVN